MNRAGLLQETTAWMDTVDLALCPVSYTHLTLPTIA